MSGSGYACVDYWFCIFEYNGEPYAAFVSDMLYIVEIKLDKETGKYGTRLVNEFLIAPSCRITITSNEESLAISYNDNNSQNVANNLIYAIPHSVAVDRSKSRQVPNDHLPDLLKRSRRARGRWLTSRKLRHLFFSCLVFNNYRIN